MKKRYLWPPVKFPLFEGNLGARSGFQTQVCGEGLTGHLSVSVAWVLGGWLQAVSTTLLGRIAPSSCCCLFFFFNFLNFFMVESLLSCG